MDDGGHQASILTEWDAVLAGCLCSGDATYARNAEPAQDHAAGASLGHGSRRPGRSGFQYSRAMVPYFDTTGRLMKLALPGVCQTRWVALM
jgi:hypothetical protein